MKRSLAALALLCTAALQANNIQVSNGSLINFDGVNQTVDVQFTVSWENSWRTSTVAPLNWDAAWVFVKYRDVSTGLWQHCRLGTAHTAPGGTTITTGLLSPGTAYDAASNWGVGAFVHRSADGLGSFSATNAALRWNWGTNGVLIQNVAEVRVFAIEMVLVPEGSFQVGDGVSDVSFRAVPGSGPYTVTGEGPLACGATAGNLNDLQNLLPAGTLAASFPKGFAAFYCMKYEVSQQQYTDFLNSLSRTQQTTRTGVLNSSQVYSMTGAGAVSFRQGIRVSTPVPTTTPCTFFCDQNANGVGGDANDGAWIACNYLSWADLGAYLDWSGLRPMTELEFEKVCRGPATPVGGEYAWGTTALTSVAAINNGGTASETSATAGANAALNGAGPLRVGALAGITTRAQSGSSYYGAMDMTGNVYERAMTAHPIALFTGLHGDGTLSAAGNFDLPSWAFGTGSTLSQQASNPRLRGGAWTGVTTQGRSSDRSLPNPEINRTSTTGGRGVRVVP
jgi:formylglycine-generating enzyme required for sulfatase activity